MFKRIVTIALTAGAVMAFGGVVIAGAQSVDNKPAPAFVPEAVPEVTLLAPVPTTTPTVPTTQPPATVATTVPTSQPRATTVSSVPTSTPTSQPRTTVTSVSTSVPGSTTVVTIDDHGGDRVRTGNSGSGRSGGGRDE